MLPLARDVAQFARMLHTAGWVANHDGNVSARASDGKRFFATPTAISKRLIQAEDIVVVETADAILVTHNEAEAKAMADRVCVCTLRPTPPAPMSMPSSMRTPSRAPPSASRARNSARRHCPR